MDIKQELKNHFIAQKIISVISITIWSIILVYILYKIIFDGIQNMTTFDWIIGGWGIIDIVYEVFRFIMNRNKIKELECDPANLTEQ